MHQIIYPPEITDVSGKIIFLAGPIQGAPEWHLEAIKILNEIIKSPITIACPKRQNDSWVYDFNRQVDWESAFLEKSSRTGVILFWLAKEHKHQCDRAYAQTTRFELAEWLKEAYISANCQVTVGIEDGFPGARYIRRRVATHYPKVIVHNTLKATCYQARYLLEKH